MINSLIISPVACLVNWTVVGVSLSLISSLFSQNSSYSKNKSCKLNFGSRQKVVPFSFFQITSFFNLTVPFLLLEF